MGKCCRTRCVNPESAQNWLFYLYSLWNVEEGASTPEGRMQGSVFIALDWYTGGHEVLLYQFRILTHSGIEIRQDDALLRKSIVQFTADHRGIALYYQASTHINQCILQCLFDNRRKYLAALNRHIGKKFLELEPRERLQRSQVSPPSKRSRGALVDLPRMQTLLKHPLRLSLQAREFLYSTAGETCCQHISH